jgi:hypothetical protein
MTHTHTHTHIHSLVACREKQAEIFFLLISFLETRIVCFELISLCLFLIYRFHQHGQVLAKAVMKQRKKRNRNFEHHHFLKNVKKKKKLLIKTNLKQKQSYIYISRYSLVLLWCSLNSFFFVEKFLWFIIPSHFFFYCMCVGQLSLLLYIVVFVCINL